MQRAIVFFSRALEVRQDGSRLHAAASRPLPCLQTSLNLWCEVQRRGAAECSGVGAPFARRRHVSRRLKTRLLGVSLLLQMWHCVTALMGAGCGTREGSQVFFAFFKSCDRDGGVVGEKNRLLAVDKDPSLTPGLLEV